MVTGGGCGRGLESVVVTEEEEKKGKRCDLRKPKSVSMFEDTPKTEGYDSP